MHLANAYFISASNIRLRFASGISRSEWTSTVLSSGEEATNINKSSESEALADSLSEVVVVILESISIGLEDEVPGSSTSLSLAVGSSSAAIDDVKEVSTAVAVFATSR